MTNDATPEFTPGTPPLAAPRRRRRTTLAVALSAALLAIPALAACGGGSDESTASDGLTKVALQFVFEKNVQFAGSYFADQNGYWKDEGLDVDLLAGGPNLSVEPVVTSGKALVGIAHTAQAVKAIDAGAGLKIIGAGFQRNPFVLISRADKPIKTPQDLAGKTIGVQALDRPVFDAFCKANDIDQSTFKIVPLQADPTPLVNGELDGIMGFYSNEPNFLRIKGVEPYELRYDEFGYKLMEEVYIVKESNLKDPEKRAQIVSLMKGESKGWSDALADPDKAADLATNVYGKDLKLDLKQQQMAMKSELDVVPSADTEKHGLFWMTDDLIAGTVNSLKLGGVEASPDMFTDEILEDVYADKAKG